jgi:hypothetical protein
VALTAALGPVEELGSITVTLSDRDIERVLERREAREARKLAAQTARAALSADLNVAATDARMALTAVMGRSGD